MDRSEKFLDFLNKLCLGLLVVVTGWAALLNRPLFSDGSLRVYDFLTTQSFPHNMPSLRWTTHFMQIPSWISYNFFKGDLAVNLGLTAFSWSYAFYPLLGLLFVLRFVPKEEEFYRKFLLITFIWIIHPASLFAVNYVNESAMLFLFATTLIQFHSNRNFFLPLILLSFFGLAVGYESGIIFVPVLGLQMYLKKRTGDLSKLRFLILSFTACLVAAWLFKELYRFDTVVTTPHTIGFWSSFGRWRYSHLHKGITFIPISLCLLFLFKNKTKFQVLPLLLVGLCFYFSMVDIFIREIPMTAGLAFDLRVWVAPLLGISYFFFHFSHWKGWDRFSVQKEAASKIILLGLLLAVSHETLVNSGLREGINYYQQKIEGKSGCIKLEKNEIEYLAAHSISDWAIPYWSIVMAKQEKIKLVLGDDFYLDRLPLCGRKGFKEKRGLLNFSLSLKGSPLSK